MRDRLAATLDLIAAKAPVGADDWWLIGSAAAALMGVDMEPEDVDIFGGTATIRRFCDALGSQPKPPAPHTLFKSEPFEIFAGEGLLPIELMGDMQLWRNGAWTPLVISSRIAVAVTGGTVYVPSLAEQAEIFTAFGRDKDLDKAARLRRKLERSV
ncbi:MAG TPA: hypothetical protein VG839_07100 [Asticcacaulis sp.]|nr:hypothetical protein [Asticcacaulis sp.]